jgi:hypothetical protein
MPTWKYHQPTPSHMTYNISYFAFLLNVRGELNVSSRHQRREILTFLFRLSAAWIKKVRGANIICMSRTNLNTLFPQSEASGGFIRNFMQTTLGRMNIYAAIKIHAKWVFGGHTPRGGGAHQNTRHVAMSRNCYISSSGLAPKLYYSLTIAPIFITHFVSACWIYNGWMGTPWLKLP